MVKNRWCVWLFILSIFLLGDKVFCAERYFEKGFFQMKIPPKWCVVPKEEMVRFQRNIFEVHNTKIEYDLALQAIESAGWFYHPYILIQIDNRGRPYTEGQIKGGIKKSISSKRDEYKNASFDLKDNAVFYDEEKNIIYTKVLIDDGKTQIKSLLAQILTNYGAVRIMFYDRANSYAENISLMHDFVQSIIIDPDMRYPKKSSRQNSDPLARALSMGVVAAIFFFIRRMMKNRKKS